MTLFVRMGYRFVAFDTHHYLVSQINGTSNIHVLLNSKVVEVRGDNRLEFVTILNTQTRERRTVPCSTLYIFIDAVPHTEIFARLIERDANDFILTGPRLNTG